MTPETRTVRGQTARHFVITGRRISSWYKTNQSYQCS